MKISVSILSKINDYKKAIEKINNTKIDYLHLDIMDNTFTKSTSFSYEQALDISKLNNKKLDIHIMSNNLDDILDDYIKLKPNIIYIHYEIKNDITMYIKKIKDNNIKVGLAINPETKVKEIKKYLPLINYVLVMSVNPGYPGQTFIEDIPKLKELKTLKDEFNFKIVIDGGINNKTVKVVKEYVDMVVIGSYITNNIDYNCQIDEIYKNI